MNRRGNCLPGGFVRNGAKTDIDSGYEVTRLVLRRLPRKMHQATEKLAGAFSAHGRELYLVGGSVRDLLLSYEAADLDFTTDALPHETLEIGTAAGATSTYTVGERFGTVGLVFDDLAIEVTTFRSETYPTSDRRPVVEFGDSIHGDLSRRDFTINAIAIDATTGALIDPFGGRQHLEERIVAAVGDAPARFNEDPLRILRAARFAAQLGFRVEENTRAAMSEIAHRLQHISAERIAAEMNRLLAGVAPSNGMQLMRETGLLQFTIPELLDIAEDEKRGRHKDIWDHTMQVLDKSPPRLAVRWAALLHDAGKPRTRRVDDDGEVHFFGHERVGADMARRALKRLRQERNLINRVSRLVELHLRPAGYDETWTDSAVRRLMVEVGDELDDLLDLAAADVTSARAHRQRDAARRNQELRDHIARLREEHALEQLKSPIDGNELMAEFDRPPGRWIAEIKDHLREMVIDGDLAPGDKDRAMEIARELVKNQQ
jgi:poly(A) polymerase